MAGIPGNKDGIKRSNKVNKKVEPLISPETLVKRYLFGIELVDLDGNEMSNETLQEYIDNAVSMLEHDLDMSITPVIDDVDEKDYRLNDYADWGYIMLNNFPVIQVKSMEMVYFRDENGVAETIQAIPPNWIRLQAHDGMIRLVPNAKFPANLQVSQTGNFFPEVLRTNMVPNLWRITYDHGFEDGKIPVMMNHVIGLIAAVQALIVVGNLVLGAGIAASTISLDGLSQSIQTTQSAENSSYSATIKEYQRLLYGANKDDPSAMIKILRRYYKGEEVNII